MPSLTMEDVEQRIFVTKSGKAPRDDGLRAMVWKQISPVVKDRVLLLFQISLDEGELPAQCRNANIVAGLCGPCHVVRRHVIRDVHKYCDAYVLHS